MKNALQCCTCVLLLVLLGTPFLRLQSQTNPPQAATGSAQANPADVDSVEHIIAALYDTISGPAGPRNWDRFRSLFYPGARLIPSRRDESGKINANSLTVDQYAERAKALFDKDGFFEAPAANRIEIW